MIDLGFKNLQEVGICRASACSECETLGGRERDSEQTIVAMVKKMEMTMTIMMMMMKMILGDKSR